MKWWDATKKRPTAEVGVRLARHGKRSEGAAGAEAQPATP